MFVLVLVCVPRVRLLDTLQWDHRQVRQWDQKHAVFAWLVWVTWAPLGKQPLGVQKRALRSALRAGGWSGPVDCSAQRIRTQDQVRSTGFKLQCDCVHQGERTQQPSVLNITMCIWLLSAGCFFMLQEFLFFIHSIPFYMILNSFLAVFQFYNAKQCRVTVCFTSLSIFHLTLLFLCSSLDALTCCVLPPGVLCLMLFSAPSWSFLN